MSHKFTDLAKVTLEHGGVVNKYEIKFRNRVEYIYAMDSEEVITYFKVQGNLTWTDSYTESKAKRLDEGKVFYLISKDNIEIKLVDNNFKLEKINKD